MYFHIFFRLLLWTHLAPYLEFETTLETSEEDVKNECILAEEDVFSHFLSSSFVDPLGPVLRVRNYTRNECRRCETTLEASVEDAKLHSKRVEKMQHYT